MNRSISDFFEAFSDVISIHETHLCYEMVTEKVPSFLRGWFELMKLDSRVKFEFFRDYWLNTLAYTPQAYDAITHFFSRIEDFTVYLTKREKDESYVASLIYCMKEEADFFLGGLPLGEKQIDQLTKKYNFPFPTDYLDFFRIHNGFCRSKDEGLVPTFKMRKELEKQPKIFPFYTGYDSYQWFFKFQGENVFCESGTTTFPSFLDWLLSYINPNWSNHG